MWRWWRARRVFLSQRHGAGAGAQRQDDPVDQGVAHRPVNERDRVAEQAVRVGQQLEIAEVRGQDNGTARGCRSEGRLPGGVVLGGDIARDALRRERLQVTHLRTHAAEVARRGAQNGAVLRSAALGKRDR